MNPTAQKTTSASDSRHPFDSYIARKFILLFLIVLVLLFDLMILGYSKIISQEFSAKKISQRLPNPLERPINRLTQGYPIEKMTPLIARQNKTTAAFLVSVAKQESDWGKHVPVLNGQDCYNYWGFRGQAPRMSHDGFTCFDSPQQAVQTVAKRFNDLISNSNLNTPQKMVVWECGHDCANRPDQETSTWINGVSYYFDKLCPDENKG
jgi:hypothetical protein